MVNTRFGVASPEPHPALPVAGVLVRVYLVLVVGTIAALAMLTVVAPRLATTDAWGHAIVVAVFAVLLSLRLRRAQVGRRGAVRAVGLISAVLLLVNVVEALIPGFVPAWMCVVMGLTAAVMAGVVLVPSDGRSCTRIETVPIDVGDPASPQRRQRLSAEDRRAQIIDAAVEVIAAAGYANATLTAVAEAAGVAKGLVWHYFEDRDDLMRQAAAQLSAQLREALVTDLDLTASASEVIRAVFTRTALFTRTHGTELETIDQIVHNLRTPDGRQRLSMLDYESTYVEHEQLLARGQREGTIRAGDVRIMALGYQGTIDAMIGYLQAHINIDPTTHAAQQADLFLDGAAARRSPN